MLKNSNDLCCALQARKTQLWTSLKIAELGKPSFRRIVNVMEAKIQIDFKF